MYTGEYLVNNQPCQRSGIFQHIIENGLYNEQIILQRVYNPSRSELASFEFVRFHHIDLDECDDPNEKRRELELMEKLINKQIDFLDIYCLATDNYREYSPVLNVSLRNLLSGFYSRNSSTVRKTLPDFMHDVINESYLFKADFETYFLSTQAQGKKHSVHNLGSCNLKFYNGIYNANDPKDLSCHIDNYLISMLNQATENLKNYKGCPPFKDQESQNQIEMKLTQHITNLKSIAENKKEYDIKAGRSPSQLLATMGLFAESDGRNTKQVDNAPKKHGFCNIS